jgi:hypothetical protein
VLVSDFDASSLTGRKVSSKWLNSATIEWAAFTADAQKRHQGSIEGARLRHELLRKFTSSHRNGRLTVFQITIITRSHGWVFGLARRGDAFDEGVVVGLQKEGNGQTLCP